MSSPEGPSAVRDYLTVVHRRRGPLLLVLIAVCGGIMAVTFVQTPTYEATASVLLQPDLAGALADDALTAQLVQNQSEVEVMRSRSVAELAARELGHAPDVSFDTVPETNVVEVTASSGDPATAASDATGYADTTAARVLLHTGVIDIDERLLVAGDSGNDLAMFEICPRGILVGNARDELRSAVRPDWARACREGPSDHTHSPQMPRIPGARHPCASMRSWTLPTVTVTAPITGRGRRVHRSVHRSAPAS